MIYLGSIHENNATPGMRAIRSRVNTKSGFFRGRRGEDTEIEMWPTSRSCHDPYRDLLFKVVCLGMYPAVFGGCSAALFFAQRYLSLTDSISAVLFWTTFNDLKLSSLIAKMSWLLRNNHFACEVRCIRDSYYPLNPRGSERPNIRTYGTTINIMPMRLVGFQGCPYIIRPILRACL